MAKKKAKDKKEKPQLDTGGGAYVGGNVNTGGGEFTGRDKQVSASGGGVAIGGSAANNLIVTGDGNVLRQVRMLFAPVYQAIEQSGRPAQAQADLTAEVREIEAEVSKGEQADESFLARRLRNLRRMTPDIADLVLAGLSGPGAVVAALVRKVAEKVKGEPLDKSTPPAIVGSS